MSTKRVIIYVDGFNFYFGLRSSKWKKYYWLDLVSFFLKFLKEHQILIQVNYFSAIPHDQGKEDRQDLFFSANKLSPRFKLHLGKFLEKRLLCKTCGASHITYEEKESDVRLGTAMIGDVVNDRCDVSILVSADSDLLPPIEFIREFKPAHKIFVYFPPKRFSYDLSNKCDGHIKLERHEEKFQRSLLPNEIIHPANQYLIKRPASWI